VDSGGYPFVSSSVPIGFRIAQIPVVNHFLEYVTPLPRIRDTAEPCRGERAQRLR